MEHFFARWFSMGIAASTNLFDYEKDSSVTILQLNTTTLLAVSTVAVQQDDLVTNIFEVR